MKYRAEIDGLRALAVLPVILFHAGFEWFGGGFVGVDVFFVISGYLITTIIIDEMGEGKFSLVKFYERRARRILPALFFVILACLPFAWFWLTPKNNLDFGQSLVAVATFSSNILFWLESDYFDTATELKPLLHTWSLAVEEQYYILFPLFLMLTWRLGLKWILVLVVLVFIISLSAAHWGAYNEPSGTFYLLPTRGWELLIGVCAAFYLKHNDYFESDLLNQCASLLGFGLIAYSVIAFDESTPFPSLYALIPTVGTVLLILTAVPRTWIHKLLSLAPIVGIGLISYSAYLWHQPMLAFARHRTFGVLSDAALLAICMVSIAMAYVSWRWVEKPFRDKTKTDRKTIFGFSLVGIVFFVGVGLASHLQNGFEYREIAYYDRINNLDLGGYHFNNAELQQLSWSDLRELSGDESYQTEDNPFDNELWYEAGDEREKALLVGNSHSKDLYNVFANSRKISEQFQIARYGTQVRDIDETFFSSPNYISSDLVVIVSRYREADLDYLEDVVVRILGDGKKMVLAHRMFSFYYNELINEADRIIVSSYDNVENKEALIELVNAAYTEAYKKGEAYNDNLYSYSHIELQQLAERYPNIRLLDRMDYVCPADEGCYGMDQNFSKLYFDHGHHTNDGAIFFGKIIDRTDFSDVLNFGE